MILTAQHGYDAKGRLLTVFLSREQADQFAPLSSLSMAKHNGYLSLNVDRPKRARSTGPRSINNRIHGHCEDIAEQLPADERGRRFTSDEIYDAMKRMSVSEGYPTHLSVDGTEVPLPMGTPCSPEEALIVSRVIQRFADEHDFYLTEYDETVNPPVSYRSKGGRSRAEMARLIESSQEAIGLQEGEGE